MDPDLKMIIIATDNDNDIDNINEVDKPTDIEIETVKENEKEKEKSAPKDSLKEDEKQIIIEKESGKDISKEIEEENQNIILTSPPNNTYSNLSITEEINESFKEKRDIPQILSRDIYRCHLCKELMTTKITKKDFCSNI